MLIHDDAEFCPLSSARERRAAVAGLDITAHEVVITAAEDASFFVVILDSYSERRAVEMDMPRRLNGARRHAQCRWGQLCSIGASVSSQIVRDHHEERD